MSKNHNETRSEFDTAGVTVIPRAVDQDTCDQILPELHGLTAGARLAEPSSTIRKLIGPQGTLGQLATDLAGPNARPVRILAFDKSPERNWTLGWHQDRVIAVKSRAETQGYDNWTVKAGVPHVEPPQSVLEQMFSLRLHLDNCGADNGPLKVVPGSWRKGRVEKPDLLAMVDNAITHICSAKQGDVLAMRALTFHASDAATTPTHRRVLHIDYATCDLPGKLEWFFDSQQEHTA